MAFHDDAHTSQPVTNNHRSKLAQIELLARQHNNPGVNYGAHRLASQIVSIIEGRSRCIECGAASVSDQTVCDC